MSALAKLSAADMTTINHHLAKRGICHLSPIFTPEEIATIDRAVDPILAARANEPRAYVYSDELGELGLLDRILSPRMREVLFGILPDAVLYHLHVYEIAANQNQPHIFADTMAGWHRDPDSENGGRSATHISIFVYLTDVGPENGPFELIPQHPVSMLHKRTRYASMTGKAGSSFAWNRSFYHRASPNRSDIRRRLLKISVQNNRFESVHLANEHFSKLIAATPAGDEALDLLLGRYQGKNAPLQTPANPPSFTPVTPQHQLGLTNRYLAEWQARFMVRAVKNRLKEHKQARAAAYD